MTTLRVVGSVFQIPSSCTLRLGSSGPVRSEAIAREVDAIRGELAWSDRLLPPNPPGVEVDGVWGRPLMLGRALGRPATARGSGRPSASSSRTSAASSVSLSGSSLSGSSSTAAAAIAD